jgi:hypothetical protein
MCNPATTSCRPWRKKNREGPRSLVGPEKPRSSEQIRARTLAQVGVHKAHRGEELINSSIQMLENYGLNVQYNINRSTIELVPLDKTGEPAGGPVRRPVSILFLGLHRVAT